MPRWNGRLATGWDGLSDNFRLFVVFLARLFVLGRGGHGGSEGSNLLWVCFCGCLSTLLLLAVVGMVWYECFTVMTVSSLLIATKEPPVPDCASFKRFAS